MFEMAIEPMVNVGGPETVLLDDGWSVVTATSASSVLPQVLTAWIAVVLYRFEVNLRSATVLGMVGAQLIGEFAWSIENLLNKIINQTLEPTPSMVAFVTEASAALPQQSAGATPFGFDFSNDGTLVVSDVRTFEQRRAPVDSDRKHAWLASFPLAYRSSYVASKAAIKGFSNGARHELSPFGVWLTTVEPGSIATGISERRTKYIGADSPYQKDFGRMLAALEAQLPGLSDPEDLRGKAASALEAQAEELVREARYDCDGDTLLLIVEQEGAGACHTGEYSCFYRSFADPDVRPNG